MSIAPFSHRLCFPTACSSHRSLLLNARKSTICTCHQQRATTRSSWQHKLFSLGVGCLFAVTSVLDVGGNRQANAALQPNVVRPAAYEEVVQRRSKRSNTSLPDASETDALMSFDRELFTEDAWRGMLKIKQYAEYVESLEPLEEESTCELCVDHRLMLEKAWQVVANEYYDPAGNFSQADWAEELLSVLQQNGGVLRTKNEAYAAIQDLIAALHDPYSEFLNPMRFRQALRRPQPAEREYLAAQYIGVGLRIGSKSEAGGRIIESTLPGSPAEEAGVVRGDRLLDIDGMDAGDLTADEVAALLRGPRGSNVTVTVASSMFDAKARSLDLERRPLPQPPLKHAMLPTADGKRVLYMRLFYFSSDATQALTEAIRDAERDASVQGYILDLRNNPGGVFEEAVAMASLLLDGPAFVAETVRNADVIDNIFQVGNLSHEMFPALPGALTVKPLAVLTNRQTASASEVLVGALRDNRRAVIVGEKTFGKGVVQYYFPLGDGSGVKVTIAKYLTPLRYDISREGGLPPDVVCHDFPHGVLSKGAADQCVTTALNVIASDGSRTSKSRMMPSPLFASVRD